MRMQLRPTCLCLSTLCAINGMSHLAYLGQMFIFAVGIFSKGWVLSRNPLYILYLCVSVFGNSWWISQIPISPCHTLCTTIWGICKGYVEGWYTRLCPRYGAWSIRTCQFPSYPPSSPRYVEVGGIPLIGALEALFVSVCLTEIPLWHKTFLHGCQLLLDWCLPWDCTFEAYVRSNERSQCLHPLHPKTQDKRIHVIEYM